MDLIMRFNFEGFGRFWVPLLELQNGIFDKVAALCLDTGFIDALLESICSKGISCRFKMTFFFNLEYEQSIPKIPI